MKLVDRDALVVKIGRWIELLTNEKNQEGVSQIDKLCLGCRIAELQEVKAFINTLEVIDPYEQCIQYASVESGIKAHAETYSFNIESELFNQLTKEQQTLWRKEIEQACISGGEMGVELARDPRYKENLEAKEVDLGTELGNYIEHYRNRETGYSMLDVARHFFELGLKVQKGE